MTGRSVEDRPLVARAHGDPDAALRVLVFGGIHGDEPGSVAVVERLERILSDMPPDGAYVVVAPAVNPDGLAAGTKNNARGVDLNRNFPSTNWRARALDPRAATEAAILRDAPAPTGGYAPGTTPLCEPESAWLAALVENTRPTRIVSVHQPLACVNFDGPAADLATRMAAACGWPVVADLGYPTPGSFGSRYGVDGGLPVVTLELPRPADEDALAAGLRALRVALLP